MFASGGLQGEIAAATPYNLRSCDTGLTAALLFSGPQDPSTLNYNPPSRIRQQ